MKKLIQARNIFINKNKFNIDKRSLTVRVTTVDESSRWGEPILCVRVDWDRWRHLTGSKRKQLGYLLIIFNLD